MLNFSEMAVLIPLQIYLVLLAPPLLLFCYHLSFPAFPCFPFLSHSQSFHPFSPIRPSFLNLGVLLYSIPIILPVVFLSSSFLLLRLPHPPILPVLPSCSSSPPWHVSYSFTSLFFSRTSFLIPAFSLSLSAHLSSFILSMFCIFIHFLFLIINIAQFLAHVSPPHLSYHMACNECSVGT